jgi:nitrate/nitrite transport system substrate-binding protein
MTLDSQCLPTCEKQHLRLGYLRLTDSAPLIMARELGLYQRYGLEVELCREVSWANVRDKLVAGDLDASQMLAPLPLATSLGLGGLRAEVITGLALSMNGNAITLSEKLAGAVLPGPSEAPLGARESALALGRYLRERSGAGPLVLASAHTFSCHTFQLHHWLRAGGVDTNRDVRIIVLPPEQMVDSLSRGLIDGFCVGEPWNTLAVQSGLGAVAATGYQVWNNSLEKVLGVTGSWHQQYPGTHLRLRLALMEACAWMIEPDNRRAAVEVMARRAYLDLPTEVLWPSLSGEFTLARSGPVVDMPHFHVFGRFQAGFPWHSDGECLLREIGALVGKGLPADSVKALVQQSYRTDLYREAAGRLGWVSPGPDYRPLNTHAQSWEMEPGIEMGPDLLL